MNILAINGSHQGKKGFTQKIIDKIFNGALEHGASCEAVILKDMQINMCKGCQACQTEKSLMKCIYGDNDDFHLIINKMKQADIIILATPIYVFTMSGLMKIFLERFMAHGNTNDLLISNKGLIFYNRSDKEILSKPFVMLTCCDNIETESYKNLYQFLKTFMKFTNAHQVGFIARRGVRFIQLVEKTKNEMFLPRVQIIYQAFYNAGKELAVKGRISASTQRRANQHIVNIPLLDFLMKIRPFKKLMLKKMHERF